MSVEILEMTVADSPFIPSLPTPHQIRFLELECLEALYGGAAGGGKSQSLLMAALQFVEVPGYSALLMRRTFADLKLPGALIDRAHEWLAGTGAKYNAQEHRWRFPSGATLQFGYCDNEEDVYRYQGAEFQFIGIDEATQLTEKQITYLFSRLRRRHEIPVPPRFRLASNPGGPGHTFIKSRFGIGSAEGPPDGRCFIPAKLADNPHVDEQQYRVALAELDPVSRAQLEDGDWDAIASGRFDGVALRRHRYRVLDRHGAGQMEFLLLVDGVEVRRVRLADCSIFLTCDPAASDEPIKKGRDPDFTAICAWAMTPDFHLIWLDTHRFRKEIPDILPQVRSMYDQHQPLFVGIEAVASNRAVFQYAKGTSMVVRELSPKGQNKLMRAAPAMTKVSQGKLWLPERAHWLDQAITELLIFKGDGKTHDDVVDNASYACALLDEFDTGDAGSAPMTLTGRKW